MIDVEMIGGLRWGIRRGTTDWNTINACTTCDEYKLGPLAVRGELVFDIGAHVGGVGVWMAAGGARVVLVEPHPENVERINDNLRLNGLTAEVIEAALGTSSISPGPKGDPHEFIANAWHTERDIQVVEVTFSQLVAVYGSPAIVKLDCEGGEWSVFNDGVIHDVPLIVGEYHQDPNDQGYEASDIAVLLPEHDVTTDGTSTLGAFRAVRR